MIYKNEIIMINAIKKKKVSKLAWPWPFFLYDHGTPLINIRIHPQSVMLSCLQFRSSCTIIIYEDTDFAIHVYFVVY